jgi:hypothetical protein
MSGRRALITSFFVGATTGVVMAKSKSAGSDSVSLSESFLPEKNSGF